MVIHQNGGLIDIVDWTKKCKKRFQELKQISVSFL